MHTIILDLIGGKVSQFLFAQKFWGLLLPAPSPLIRRQNLEAARVCAVGDAQQSQACVDTLCVSPCFFFLLAGQIMQRCQILGERDADRRRVRGEGG